MWRTLLGIVLTTLMLSGIAAGATLFWAVQTFNNPMPLPRQAILLEIKAGQTVSDAFEMLRQQGLVMTPYLYHVGTRLQGMRGSIKAGEYQLSGSMSAADAMRLFESGPNYRRRITFPEGLTSHEIVMLMNAADDMSGTISPLPAEGSILPETYEYAKNVSRGTLVEQMQQAMQKTLAAAWEKRVADLPLKTPQEALTLASIIEKETGIAAERRRVAGVFINRLRAGMPLQTDPTVIYALTKGKPQTGGQGPIGRALLKTDLTIDSPYNTYKYAGLPPAPIANPGKASIEAALNPEPHDFLYFVADGTGGHAFAKTLTEHNANVAKWRQIKK